MNNKKNETLRKKLINSSVGIAGAGGLGSNVAISLVRTGIGRLVIVDFDTVEESNLNRQYYFKNQVGKLKVDALKENILRINPKIKIDVFNERLVKGTMHKYFKDVDVIVEALDNAETKTSFIEEVMDKLTEIPIVSASGVTGYGNIDRIKSINMGNLHMIYDKNAKDSDKDILTAPKVALIANWQANIILEILLGEDI